MNIVKSVYIKKQDPKGEWTCYAITTDDGRKASGFDTVQIGDMVDLSPSKKDPRYLNYSVRNGKEGDDSCRGQLTTPPSSAAPKVQSSGAADVDGAREHIMKAVNLYNLCVNAVDTCVKPHINNMTAELYQAAIASIWIEASGRRSTNGVDWWSYVDDMPSKPAKETPF